MEHDPPSLLLSVQVEPVVTYVEVHTDQDGSLLVSWSLAAGPAAVDVATGPTPDHLDHRHESTVPAGETRLRLAGSRDGRTFVSVSPRGGGSAVVAADRRIGFQGATNFRDLGGYRTRSNGRIRWGQIFRADALHALSKQDLVLYERLGLHSVFDLRGEQERDERPNQVDSMLVTIVGRAPGTTPAPPPGGMSTADGERFLGDLYVGLLQHASEPIGRIFRALAAAEALPAVFHCHAGKDRTGIVAALLLEALDVDRDTILDDYELTSRYRQRIHQTESYERLLASGLAPEAAAGVLTTPRWAMQSALETLDEIHGGIEGWLMGPAGLDQEEVVALRQRLVDPAP